MSSNPPVIQFEDVTKRYYIQQRSTPRLGAWIANKLFEHLRRVPYEALSGVSFEIKQGDFAGLLGVNGAGKSTILKLIAGITQPTSGTVRVSGRVASLLELGVGFHPDLTGIENIFYNGSIMGLSRDEIRERLETIIDFSGLRPFLLQPVKHYSSGMYARLGCSVALHLDPDIILLDEILAVGDADFQQRSLNRLLKLYENGTTILLVTHVLQAARTLCDHLIWLEKGTVIEDGEADRVYAEYQKHINTLSTPASNLFSEKQPLAPTAAAVGANIAELWLTNGDGNRVEAIETGQPAELCFRAEPGRIEGKWRIGFALKWIEGETLFEEFSDLIATNDQATLRYRINSWPFHEHRLRVDVVILDEQGQLLARKIGAFEFETTNPIDYSTVDCLLAPPARWTVKKLSDSVS